MDNSSEEQILTDIFLPYEPSINVTLDIDTTTSDDFNKFFLVRYNNKDDTSHRNDHRIFQRDVSDRKRKH